MKLLFFFSFLAVTNAFSKEKLSFSAEEIQKLSHNRLQKLRSTYIDFVSHVENDKKWIPDKVNNAEKYSNFLRSMRDFNLSLFQTAYAEGEEVCFFGGWPSVKRGRYCTAPWNANGNGQIQTMGAYSREKSCGSSDEFRCNPILFGAPTAEIAQGYQGPPEVNFEPNNGMEAGYCIKTGGGYEDLTTKCEQASQGSTQSVIDSFRNPQKAGQLAAFSHGVAQFCHTNPDYDACDALKTRLDEISGGDFDACARARWSENQDRNSHSPILNKCRDLAEREGLDVFDRDIFQTLSPDGAATCSPNSVIELADSFQDFRDLSSFNQKKDLLKKLNYQSARLAALSTLSMQHVYGSGLGINRYDLNNVDNFIRQFTSGNSNVGQDSDSRQALVDAFNEFKARQSRLPQIDFNAQIAAYDQFAERMNQKCSEMKSLFEQEGHDPDQNIIRKAWDSPREKSFYDQHHERLQTELSTYIHDSENKLGLFFATEVFKTDVLDPTFNHAEQCIKANGYQPLKTPLTREILTRAVQATSSQMRGMLPELNESLAAASRGSREDVSDHLQNYLKNSPQLAGYLLMGEDPLTQRSMAVEVCDETFNLYNNDKGANSRRTGARVAGAVGAGIALAGWAASATGVGALVGLPAAALGTAISAAAGVGVAAGAMELNEARVAYSQANQHQRGVETAHLQSLTCYQEFSEEVRLAAEERSGAVRDGVIGAVAVAPGVGVGGRLVRNAFRGADEAADATSTALAVADDVSSTGVALNAGEEASTSTSTAVAIFDDSVDEVADGVLRLPAGASQADDIAGAADDVAGAADDVADAARQGTPSASGTPIGNLQKFGVHYTEESVAAARQASGLDELPSELITRRFPDKELFGGNIQRFRPANYLSYSQAQEIYDTLNLGSKSAYHRMVRSFHPDRGGLGQGLADADLGEAVTAVGRSEYDIIHEIKSVVQKGRERGVLD